MTDEEKLEEIKLDLMEAIDYQISLGLPRREIVEALLDLFDKCLEKREKEK